MSNSLKNNRSGLALKAPGSNTLFEGKIFSERMEQLYKNLFLSVPSYLLCALVAFIALYQIPHTIALIYWFASVILISIVRIGIAFKYTHDKKYTKLRYYYFILATAISAGLWGACGSLLMPSQHPIEQMIVIVMMAGTSAGSLQSLQPSLISCILYITLGVLPLAVWTFMQESTSYTILGITVVLYLLFNIILCIRGYKFLEQALQLKYANKYLAETVSTSNKQLILKNQEIKEKESNLQLIQDHAPIGMAIVSLDGKWLNVNNKLCEIIEYTKEELEKRSIQDVTFQADIDSDLDSRTKLLSGKIQSYQVEKRYVKKDNQLTWIVTNVSLVRGKENKPLYYISQIQDINDRKQNENIISNLGKMNSMLQLCHDSSKAYDIICKTASEIFPSLSGGLGIFNKSTKVQNTVGTWGNNSLLQPLFQSDDCWAFRSGNIYITNAYKNGAICRHFEVAPQGMYLCVPLIVKNQILGMLNFSASEGHIITSYQQQIINNFSELVKLSLSNIQLKEALSEQAIHDPLTGLLNRRYLYDVLPKMLELTDQTNQRLCVCMIDLDHFKSVNDQHGHDAGDEVLKYFAHLLKNSFRKTDITCRYGGEEFIVVLVDSDIEHAYSQIEQLRLNMTKAKIAISSGELPSPTLSAGLAEAPQHGKSISDILHAADSALYTAKETGRNRIIIYQEP